jgi:hypothetical protein
MNAHEDGKIGQLMFLPSIKPINESRGERGCVKHGAK